MIFNIMRMIRGQKVDCLSHGFYLMSNFDSSVKAIGKVSTHLTEEPKIGALSCCVCSPNDLFLLLFSAH